MSFPFDPTKNLVIVEVMVAGPLGNAVFALALDTEATISVIDPALLVPLGYVPGAAGTQLQITTPTGSLLVPQLALFRVTALGQDRFNFPVLCHAIPTSARVDGLLGLDFLRGRILTLDFQNGQITLV